jgi:ATP-binding cassette, subfamily C (CFTR/MRP), member 1
MSSTTSLTICQIRLHPSPLYVRLSVACLKSHTSLSPSPLHLWRPPPPCFVCVCQGIIYVLVMFFGAAIQSVAIHQYFHRVWAVGYRLRAATVTAVYHKSLRLSRAERQARTSGTIINLMSVDAWRMQEMMPFLHSVWSMPFQIALCLYLLEQALSTAMWAGVAIMLLLIPIQTKIGSLSQDLQDALMTVRDERLKITNGALTQMKILKLYAVPLSRPSARCTLLAVGPSAR